jgi:ribosomal protein L25 (general stress protein Ctc)
MPLAIVDKRRPKENVSEVMHLIGEVEGKHAIIFDDMIDTAGTLVKAARSIKEHGALTVRACATHPVLSGPAIDNIENSELEEVLVCDAIPLSERGKRVAKIKGLDARAADCRSHSAHPQRRIGQQPVQGLRLPRRRRTMQIIEPQCRERAGNGKGPSRRTRVAGSVPGVIYGEGKEPVSITFNARRFQFDIVNKGGEHAIVQVDVRDNPALSGPRCSRAVQHHPVTGNVVHTDFLRISLDKPSPPPSRSTSWAAPRAWSMAALPISSCTRSRSSASRWTCPTSIDVDITAARSWRQLARARHRTPENVKVVSDPDRTDHRHPRAARPRGSAGRRGRG